MPIEPYIDQSPSIDRSAFIHGSACIVGDVHIGSDSSVWCNSVIRGDVNKIAIGRCTNIQDLTMCHVSHPNNAKPKGSPLLIGDYVTVGHSVILHGCTIQDESLIGMGSIVMDDVVIERNVLVGAGSLVPPGKVLESGFLYVGRPAIKIRSLSEDEVAFLRYSAEHYVRVKNGHLKNTR